MAKLISWNVLYRKYEEKYNPNSFILKTNEDDRIAQVVDLLMNNTDKKTILCLQECSVDLLSVIIDTFQNSHRIFYYNIRDKEYLVTVAPVEFEIVWTGKHETSNGYLVIKNKHVYVINCHLKPQRYYKSSVLQKLIDFLDQYKTVFIAGDFNENYKNVNKKLNSLYTCPFYGKTYRKKSIDHIIFNSQSKYTTSTIEQINISDHNPVVLNL